MDVIPDEFQGQLEDPIDSSEDEDNLDAFSVGLNEEEGGEKSEILDLAKDLSSNKDKDQLLLDENRNKQNLKIINSNSVFNSQEKVGRKHKSTTQELLQKLKYLKVLHLCELTKSFVNE